MKLKRPLAQFLSASIGVSVEPFFGALPGWKCAIQVD